MPVHTTYIERARVEAEELGRKLGEAAVVDAQGRKEYTDLEKYVDYLDNPWSVLEPYLENLTNGTMEYDTSLIEEGLRTFGRQEAVDLLQEAKGFFQQALLLHKQGDREGACDQLVRASALWTHATWKEFLEQDVIGAETPDAYRPIVED